MAALPLACSDRPMTNARRSSALRCINAPPYKQHVKSDRQKVHGNRGMQSHFSFGYVSVFIAQPKPWPLSKAQMLIGQSMHDGSTHAHAPGHNTCTCTASWREQLHTHAHVIAHTCGTRTSSSTSSAYLVCCSSARAPSRPANASAARCSTCTCVHESPGYMHGMLHISAHIKGSKYRPSST